MARRITPAQGEAAWKRCRDAYRSGNRPQRTDAATAVRYTLQLIAERAPGASVELRVVPYGATQIVEGSSHRRGTPPAVVEMTAQVWLELAAGDLTWEDAVAAGAVSASGERADLRPLLPLTG